MTLAPAPLAARWEERVMRSAHPLAYPLLNAVKRPVLRVPGLGVLVTDATLLRAVLMDTTGFTKTGPGSPSDLWTPVLGPSVLLNMEGADHLALRRRLGPLFAPSYVDPLAAASLGEPAAQLTARLRSGESVDLVEVVKGFASAMIGQLVGLTAVDDELFDRVSSITRFVRLSRPTLTPPQVASARSILDELTVHARAAWAEGDDATVPGRMRSLGLSEAEAMGAVGAFVLTGTETLVSYIPRLIALLVDSEWLPLVAADRALAEPAIAEGLRVTTPSPVMLRSVSASSPPDAAIGSVRVHPGDRVILATFAANRALGAFDPAANVAGTLKQLWFGAGTHFCLGAPLAMAQIRLTLDAILDAGGALSITSRTPARGVLIPSYASLTVRST
ncbi:MAG: cytochrome P450 [Rhodoglobus sp.]|uniref:cytochrome P450 n=1 Tax=Salinibacterium sp. G-O1 TaxID=3046208 RepID=UPI0024BBB450|nr:cytochrome P450 [Salinibacterium sp. G-O1]MDJ0335943.1 cytochrome P450 [Salinibacterium sp. G-O1]